MSGYLLDTHVLLWWAKRRERLSEPAREAIEDPANSVYVSSVSGVEIGIKSALGRLKVSSDFLDRVLGEGMQRLPLTFEHGLALAGLPALHRDPFDRLLVAQAMAEGLVLVTRDEEVARYPVAVLRG